ncbi:MAG: O-antigen ligase family protein [Elusimicrobiota bacterium]
MPLFLAAFFSLLAAVLSPVRALVLPEWWTFAAGLFVLVLAGCLDAGGRGRADIALRLSAWLIALLSLYQAFILKSPDITASLTNPNALALFTLMLLPLAIMWKDLFLLGALIITLVWTQSAAALLALLVTAGFYAKDNMKAEDIRKNWPLLLLMAVVAALAVSMLEFRSFLDRLGWWRAALQMFAASPALGFGPGSFAYVYPAFHGTHSSGISTIYVHNYYLEFLAENGFFAFVFWGWAVAARLKDAVGLKKYALIAVLAHSMTDFGLAVPANFFVFCYLLSAPGPQPAPAAAPASDKKTSAALAVMALACFTALCGIFSSQLKLERLRAEALADLSAGDQAGAEGLLEDAARLAPGNPLVPALLGRVRLRAGFDKKDTVGLFTAAVELERAVVINPYNAGAWRDLERIYADVGEQRLLDGLRKRKAEVFR